MATYKTINEYPVAFETAKLLRKAWFKEKVAHYYFADAFLRLMHLCGEFNIYIETHIRAKMAYNDLRPVRHGKAY